MREYQKKRGNPYLLPHCLYMRTLYLIRDYPRLKARAQNAQDSESGACANEVRAVEGALEMLPEFYREPVFNNIVYGCRYPLGADERTFRRYKQRCVYYAASLLGLVPAESEC